MNDDIKRALEAIYSVKTESAPVAEAEPRGIQAAQAHMTQGEELKGTFNAKMFGGLLGMDSTEASMLASFLAKHKKGMPPARNELLAAADAFRALVDADPKVTNQAMMMLRRVSAAEAIESSVAEEQVEEASVEDQIEEEIKDIAEGIRVTKEGVEECWSDMAAAPAASPIVAGGQEEPGETVTVNITTPNKQISVTTDSAEEIANLLKLAGIDGVAKAEEPAAEEPAAEEPATAVVVTEPESAESSEEEKEEAKEAAKPDFLDVDKDGDKEEPMADAVKDKKEMGEAARILALAGIDESKLANSPATTSMDEPMEADRLPSTPGDGAGHPDFGANRANNQGENPMGVHSGDMEESFNIAMGEYRKFVAENISQGVKKV